MSDLIPSLDFDDHLPKGRPPKRATRAHNVTVYLTPAEKQLLDALGKRNGGGASAGVRFLMKFFANSVKGNN